MFYFEHPAHHFSLLDGAVLVASNHSPFSPPLNLSVVLKREFPPFLLFPLRADGIQFMNHFSRP